MFVWLQEWLCPRAKNDLIVIWSWLQATQVSFALREGGRSRTGSQWQNCFVSTILSTGAGANCLVHPLTSTTRLLKIASASSQLTKPLALSILSVWARPMLTTTTSMWASTLPPPTPGGCHRNPISHITESSTLPAAAGIVPTHLCTYVWICVTYIYEIDFWMFKS